MSFGKSGGTTVQTPQLTEEQRQQIAAQTGFFTETLKPTYEQAVKGARNLYEANAPGVTYAAQNLAGTAGQAGPVPERADASGAAGRARGCAGAGRGRAAGPYPGRLLPPRQDRAG